MTPKHIKISDYEITEENFVNLATEFFGHVRFPAGNHQVAHVIFDAQEDETTDSLFSQFVRALQGYKAR